MAFAFVFPGQGSQAVGMQADLPEISAAARKTYVEASEVLGVDMLELVSSGPTETLNETTNTQPAMLTASIATWRAWMERGGPSPAVVAGHSLGEYGALVAAGAIEFRAALELVRHRARLMQDAVPAGEGAMAALLGLDDAAVVDLCAAAAGPGVVEAVNFNSPGQVVIAGDRAAVDRALAAATAAGAKRAVLLPVSVPAHSSLMRPAGERLATMIEATDFADPVIPAVCAVDGTRYDDAADVRRRLMSQVYKPVHWVRTIHCMAGFGVRNFAECGPGKVLAGLIRRIDREVATSALVSIAAIDEFRTGLEQ